MVGLRLCLAFVALWVTVMARDPEEDMTVPDIIRHWGYPAEAIQVTTADGYILELHRIPWGKNSTSSDKGNRPVVFMQHGLEAASDNWVDNLPGESAGFLFADAGFDVWLGNIRGNTYGKNHVSLDPKKKEFWAFSWDHMVQYDLETMIDYVLKTTGQDSLYYVGHSQGTLIMFSKLSEDQNFAKKIRKFFALAPVGSVKHVKGLLEYVGNYFYDEINIIGSILGDGEFLPSNWAMKLISDFVCGVFGGNELCESIIFLLGGVDSIQLNSTRIPVYVSHNPAGTSTQNVLHWAQMQRTGQVEKYDYRSSSKNQQHYNTSSPPKYDFTKVNAPVHLYWSDKDWLADKQDIQEWLIPNLPPQYLVENNFVEEFNHMDFIWGLHATEKVYNPIIKTVTEDWQKWQNSA
uniref:Lipase n=1 Tax=Panagrellus redivivus TaxID=6233 RepID=A0A7E4ZY95_PANRE